MEPRSPRLGRPPTITSEQIVDEAKRQLQTGGADALSMRALAKSLGTTPMALYRHVGDKEQLISAVLDVYSQDLGALVLPQDQVERLRTIFTAIFEKLASERWIIELLQRGGRGGSGAVVLVDRAMAACVELGMSPIAHCWSIERCGTTHSAHCSTSTTPLRDRKAACHLSRSRSEKSGPRNCRCSARCSRTGREGRRLRATWKDWKS